MEDFNSKYTGKEVEQLLDQVANGEAGGGSTITETEIAAMGFTKNVGTITEVKINGISKGTSGVVDLGEVPTKEQFDNLVDTTDSINEDVAALYDDKQDAITDLQTIREGAEKGATSVQPSDLADVATSGSYDDLSNKPDVKEILVIGTSSDEAKDNLIAVANGSKTADIYIGSIIYNGFIIESPVKLTSQGTALTFVVIGTSPYVGGELIKGYVSVQDENIASFIQEVDAGSITEEDIAAMGFTKNTGTYSKPSTGIPKTDLASDVQKTLDNAATFVVAAFDLSAIYSGDDIVYPGKDVLMNAIREGKTVRIPFIKDSLENGYVIAQAYCGDLLYMTIEDGQNIINIETSMFDPMLYASDITIHEIANRAAIEKVGELEVVVAKGVDDGIVVYATPTSANGDEDDVLLSRNTVKTINGESIFGSGNITISGGSGEQGPQGEKGDKGDKGDTGTGVQSVKQTTISNTDGGSNVVTVTLTNGTTSTFTVKNGSKGSSGTNGTNGKDGADGATFTPSVDSAGNLSWTNNKGLANPPTVNIKGPKGDKGDAGDGGGSGGGKEVVSISNGVIELLERDKIYLVANSSNSRTFEIQAIEEVDNPGEYAEYIVIFASEDDMGTGNPLSITLPDNVYWANGQIPDLTLNANYELSIVSWATFNNAGLNAVITPFKPA